MVTFIYETFLKDGYCIFYIVCIYRKFWKWFHVFLQMEMEKKIGKLSVGRYWSTCKINFFLNKTNGIYPHTMFYLIMFVFKYYFHWWVNVFPINYLRNLWHECFSKCSGYLLRVLITKYTGYLNSSEICTRCRIRILHLVWTFVYFTAVPWWCIII